MAGRGLAPDLLCSGAMLRLAPLLLLVALSGPAWAQESVQVSFGTSEAGGNYAPRNVVAVWVEDEAGTFVRTIGRWAGSRIDHLVAWSNASGQDTDAVSGATRANHDARLTVTWDLTDRNGVPVPNGTYVIRMELADRNSTSPDQNNQGAFTFVLDGQPSTQTTSDGGFLDATIDYTGVDAPLCGNGAVDADETCDPADTCPTSCPASAEQCVANTLVGAPATCNVECVEQLIEACADSDGCCPQGCVAATDDDCTPGDGAAPPTTGPIAGGCDVAHHDPDASPALALLALAALAGSRRRASGR